MDDKKEELYDLKQNQSPSDDLSDHLRTPAEEKALTRRILWKLDLYLLPPLALLFLCSFLDRTNVGNAKTFNLEKDIGISDPQYQKGLTVYYLFYILSELPSNLVLKKISPKIWLPLLTILWGIVAMSLGFVKNYAGFVAVRAILGLTEGGLLPGIVLYLSHMYRREEIALRIGLFYTSASLSGAFGGLLARGLANISPSGYIHTWRWILIIEGLLTVAIGFLCYFVLPNNIGTAGFLSHEERTFATQRLIAGSAEKDVTGEGKGGIPWGEVKRGLISISTWLSALAYFGILSGLYSFGLFLPTIIQSLGGYTPNEVQLWSVIPYAVASVFTVIVAVVSDRLKLRGVIMLFTLPVAIIGYAVIANISNKHSNVKYGMTFLMATGMYASVPCVLGWNANNSAGHYKRATTSALQLIIANSGGFVAAFIYPNSQKPQFHQGHTVVLALLVAAWFLVLANVLYCMKVNRDKANGKYEQYRGCGDDRDPDFKFVL